VQMIVAKTGSDTKALEMNDLFFARTWEVF
jgi:hypothetical protein